MAAMCDREPNGKASAAVRSDRRAAASTGA